MDPTTNAILAIILARLAPTHPPTASPAQDLSITSMRLKYAILPARTDSSVLTVHTHANLATRNA
jgi:hypothetical protein